MVTISGTIFILILSALKLVFRGGAMCSFLFGYFHSNTACLGFEGTSGDCPRQPPCSKRVGESRLPQTTTAWGLPVSKDADSTDSLGNPFPCSTLLAAKKCFLVFNRNFLGFHLCPLPLAL